VAGVAPSAHARRPAVIPDDLLAVEPARGAIADGAALGNTTAAMRRASAICGGVLAALGAAALVEAFRVADPWPGARLMPAVVGGVLVVLGAAHLARGDAGGRAWPGAAGLGRVAVVLGVLVLYVVALPRLGFLPSTALFVLALVRRLGDLSWPASLALTAAVAVAGHVVFERWLGMPLPPGLFRL